MSRCTFVVRNQQRGHRCQYRHLAVGAFCGHLLGNGWMQSIHCEAVSRIHPEQPRFVRRGQGTMEKEH